MKITNTASGVTIEEVDGYPGALFLVGFPPEGTTPNGIFVKTPEGQAATATWVRRLPLDTLFRIAATARAAEIAEEVHPGTADESRPYGGGTAHLAKVAELYQWATERGISPRTAIATRWAKSEATAGRWITEARKAGALPPKGQ
ncbi:hypothetical protein ACIQWN_38260 [Streptomyces vinaceus]|uniref:hypothetical protein n=1 Tax=Streptomyces vinaceus TaxID=1960 RepID=UPI00381D89D3